MHRNITLLSLIVMAVSTFLPWMKAFILSTIGLQGPGAIVLILAIINIILLFSLKNKNKVVGTISIILGGLSLLIAIITVIGINNGNIFGVVSIGSGLILCLISSVGTIIGGFLYFKHSKTVAVNK